MFNTSFITHLDATVIYLLNNTVFLWNFYVTEIDIVWLIKFNTELCLCELMTQQQLYCHCTVEHKETQFGCNLLRCNSDAIFIELTK